MKNRWIKYGYLTFIVLFAIVLKSWGQLNNEIIKHVSSADSANIISAFSFPKYQPNETILQTELNRWISKIRLSGYLQANIDSVVRKQNQFHVYVWIGKKYYWQKINIHQADAEWMKQAGIDENYFNHKIIEVNKWNTAIEKVLQYAENNGYPFAEIKIDSFKIKQDSVALFVKLDKHLSVSVDSFHFKYSSPVSTKYLYKYLGIQPGMLYNESVIQKIPSMLKGLSFIRETQPLSISFLAQHAIINLFLENKKSSRFNFLVGMQPVNNNPSPVNPATTNKFLISGEGDLHLENIQRSANVLDMSFRLYPQQTQNVIVKYGHPFLFNLPFGVDDRFEIFKHDSTYVDVDNAIGLQHLIKGTNYIKVFYSTHISNLVYIDTTTIKLTRKLPTFLDYRFNLVGIEINQEKLDDRFNPTSGYSLKLNIAAGYKQFVANNKIINLQDEINPMFKYASLYDSITKPIFHSRWQLNLAYYQRIFQKQVVKFQLTAAAIPDKKIFNNEMYRIGGNRMLRGFDEQSIFTSLYSIFTVEYRYLLGLNSYAYAFTDWAYTEAKTTTIQQFDTPHSYGAGVAFETSAGIFQVSYALGTRLNNPIIVRNGKVHFGYIANF